MVVVMAPFDLFVAGASIAEVEPLEDLLLLEQAYRAVDRGDTDPGIDLDHPAVQLFDIGMIVRIREHAGNDAPLLGHLHALVTAELFYPRLHGCAPPLRERVGCSCGIVKVDVERRRRMRRVPAEMI